MQTERKSILTRELSSAVQSALREHSLEHLNLSGDVITSVLNSTEAIFIHGLREQYFLKNSRYHKYPEPTFWPFVCKFISRGTRAQISSYSQIKTEVGKCRAWLRLSLNECAMESHIDSFKRDPHALQRFYHRWAYIRDTEHIEVLKDYMKALGGCRFSAPVNSTMINSWTPTPLRLAGLLTDTSGNGRHIGAIPELDDLDVPVGVSALEYEGIEEGPSDDSGSFHYPRPTPSCVSSTMPPSTIGDFGDSDETQSMMSEYSHASLVEAAKFDAILSNLDVSAKSGELCDSGTASFPRGSPPSLKEETRGQADIAEVIVHRHLVNAAQPCPKDLDVIKSSAGQEPKIPEIKLTTSDTVRERSGAFCDSPSAINAIGDHPDTSVNSSNNNEFSFMTDHMGEPEDQHNNTSISVNSVTGRLQREEHIFRVSHVSGNSQDSEERRDSTSTPGGSSDAASGGSMVGVSFRSDCFSPGNSLLGRSGWSSGFVSNLPHDGEQRCFNDVLRDALTSAVLSSSPVRAVENSNTNQTEFAATANMPLEVGQAPMESEQRAVSAERSSTSLNDYVIIQSRDTTDQLKNARLSSMTRVAEETGLDFQNYKCYTCNRQIGLIFSEYRVCSFDGHYHCHDCQGQEEFVIPARIVHSWDLSKRRVSRASKAFLEHMADEPLIDIQKVNASLYEYVRELKEILQLREQLGYVAMYLLHCKESVAEDLRKRLWPKEYLFENPHLYSLNDLLNVTSGSLKTNLKSVVSFAIGHVQECRLCSQKGFICEICNDAKIIYPFQIGTTYRCDKCFSVCHISCKKGRPCPKCLRKELYLKERNDRRNSECHMTELVVEEATPWDEDELILHNAT